MAIGTERNNLFTADGSLIEVAKRKSCQAKGKI
jgi:hypothetical protein